MVELIDKPIMAEKRIIQEILERYDVMELLLGMGCVELALFAEQYNENLLKEFYANLSKEDLSLPSDSLVWALDPLVMPKIVAPVSRPSPYPSAESSEVITSLDLLNQKLSSVMASVLQIYYRFVVALCIGIVLGNLVNPEEFVIMSCDMKVRLRKFESIRKGQNPKKNRTCRESKIEVSFWELNPWSKFIRKYKTNQ
ncbi:hypothetical protein M9H77_18482 [Catharanthus roseus]|uniref:Uncharacterized protein n=1 Tax=Catharanthus roseus TaxID=4058 RepID=A0ACC0B7J9_CATRO|nr:hypothetical protein M9H77_18482 [Catharanthus roseus]